MLLKAYLAGRTKLLEYFNLYQNLRMVEAHLYVYMVTLAVEKHH